MERLEAYKEKLPYEHAVAFVGAILDVGDKIPEERGGMFVIDPVMHAARIIYWYLKQGASPDRGERLLEAVRTTTGFFLTTFVVELETQAQEKKEEADSTVTPEQLEELKRLTVERVEAAARDGRLLQHWGFTRPLYVWIKYAGEEAVKAWVGNMVTAATVVPSLRGFVLHSTSQGMGDYVSRTRYFMQLSRLEDFIPADQVEAHLARVDASALGDEDRRAVDTFREAMTRRRAGKPDYDPMRSRMEED